MGTPRLPEPERTERRKATVRRYLQSKKEVRRAKLRAWRQSNPDKVKAQGKRVDRESKRRSFAKWRSKNIDRDRARTRENKRVNRVRYTALEMARQAQQRRAMPKWADRKAILRIYHEASRLGMQVDHIVPLQSPYVCGLHWEGNLQLLTREQNSAKKNYWWPDMPATRCV